MSEQTIVVMLVIAGLATAVALAVAVWRRSALVTPPDRATLSAQALWMAAGMLFGGALGTIVWLSTGQFVFWVVFLGGGMTAGLAIGQARATNG